LAKSDAYFPTGLKNPGIESDIFITVEGVWGLLIQGVGNGKAVWGRETAPGPVASEQRSFAGELDKARFKECVPGWKYARNGRVTIEGMRREVQELSQDFAQEMSRRLTELGIDASRPFELDIARDGRVIVRGQHPDKERIESIFSEDPDFRNDMVKVHVFRNMLEHSQQARAFEREYALNPRAAVAKYSHLFTGGADHYSMWWVKKGGLWELVFSVTGRSLSAL
jgi:hypothetical protein